MVTVTRFRVAQGVPEYSARTRLFKPRFKQRWCDYSPSKYASNIPVALTDRRYIDDTA